MSPLNRLLMLMLVCANWTLLQAAFTCEEANKGGCSDCGKAVFCMQSGGKLNPIDIACSSTEVCVEKNNVGSCASLEDSSSSDCACKEDSTPGYMKDAFEKSKYIMCLPGAQYSFSCPSGQTFEETANQCVEGTTTPGADALRCEKPGFTTLPGCKTYYGCFPDPSDPTKLKPSETFECTEAEEVFDVSKGKCVSTAFECNSGDMGAQMDTVECDAFYVCADGKLLGGKQCCDEGQRFDSAKMQCVAAAQVSDDKCPSVSECIDPSSIERACPAAAAQITTQSPASGATKSGSATGSTGAADCSTDGYISYPGDCTKYYSCYGGQSTVQTCPSGLLFDASSGYCDVASKVTGC
ncbi:chitin-binding domain protein cbd-1-like [Macrobrachium rosenbergii]|uniref:chitin-binding domain protein cbd-1-like n=1 Tax=Macrobrachium rosenbergii TaxID=79674 RepID=UPI0034D62E0A